MNPTTQKVLISLVAVAFIAAMGFAIFRSGNGEGENIAVTNFEECAGAGYSVTQSNPRECRTPEGERFVEPATDANPTPITRDGCYIGGCSAQICSDESGVSSTCEYRPEYACYESGTCERQDNGKCGWTETEALKACLSIDYTDIMGK